MGRVWLGATHSGGAPEVSAPVVVTRPLAPRPDRPDHRCDEVGGEPATGRRSRWPRWPRWLSRNP
jgi:hypothetical protein